MPKKYFTKCFGCFSGYECGKTPRLPRKKKKEYKKFLKVYYQYSYRYFMDFVSSCDIVYSYKQHKKMFHILPFINKYKKEIDLIRSIGDNGCEEVYIDENGRLSWYWETDDDYGGSSGLMPFCYSEEEAGRTWAFSEVEQLVRSFFDYPKDFVFPENIKSDKDLLEFVKRTS